MEYDEIRITTRREMDICRLAIKKLEKLLAAMEEKHSITSAEFLQKFDPHGQKPIEEELNWYQSSIALQRWKERLEEHQRIMEL